MHQLWNGGGGMGTRETTDIIRFAGMWMQTLAVLLKLQKVNQYCKIFNTCRNPSQFSFRGVSQSRYRNLRCNIQYIAFLLYVVITMSLSPYQCHHVYRSTTVLPWSLVNHAPSDLINVLNIFLRQNRYLNAQISPNMCKCWPFFIF